MALPRPGCKGGEDARRDADATGERGNVVLRGDTAVVRERREASSPSYRARPAVQVELAKLRPVTPSRTHRSRQAEA